MWNATIRPLLLAAAASLLLASCSDKDRKGAEELMARSEAEVSGGNYSGALVLLDTLNQRYPAQTEVRRQALRIRAKAMEGLVSDSISDVSRALAESTVAVEQWKGKFRHVESSVGLDGYYIPECASQKVMTATGIEPRVSEKVLFYIVANVQKNIGLRSMTFTDGASSISSSEISPARVVTVEGCQTASFNPEDLEGVGLWFVNHSGKGLKVIFHGSKGNATAAVDARLRDNIVACYQYSTALRAFELASIKREKFERMLAAARDQLANLPAEESAEK